MQALLDAIATMDLPHDARRIFHGRGGIHPGCEHWVLDAYPPVWVLTGFRPATDDELTLFVRGNAWLHEQDLRRIKALAKPTVIRSGEGDTLAWIGMGLARQAGPSQPKEPKKDRPQVGSLAWVKWDSKFREKQERLEKATGGF